MCFGHRNHHGSVSTATHSLLDIGGCVDVVACRIHEACADWIGGQAMIEIWDRIRFRNGKAVYWSRSFDGGRTWAPVQWAGGELPFVSLTEPRDALVQVITRQERSK
jgi:hypothetical protein